MCPHNVMTHHAVGTQKFMFISSRHYLWSSTAPLSSTQASFPACGFTHSTTHTHTLTHNYAYTNQLLSISLVFFFFYSLCLTFMSLLSPSAPPLGLMSSLVGSTCVRLSVACNGGDSVSLASFLAFYCLTSCNDLSLVLVMLRHQVTARCGRKDSRVKTNNLCPVLPPRQLKWRLSGDISATVISLSQWGRSCSVCAWLWLKYKKNSLTAVGIIGDELLIR